MIVAAFVRRLSMLVAAVAAVLLLLAPASGALASSSAEPWWHVSTISRPTNLWVAKPEVQEVNGGALLELEVRKIPTVCVGSFGGKPSPEPGKNICEFLTGLPYAATAAELQKKLETAYETTDVEVSEPAPFAYVVTTPGKFVPALEAGAVNAGGSVTVHGGSGRLVAVVTNLGDSAAEGGASPVTITDTLPNGIAAIRVEAPAGAIGSAGSAQCKIEAGGTVTCTFSGSLPSYESIEMEIEAAVTLSSPVEGTEVGEVTVTGGGAQPVRVAQGVTLSEKPTPFGVESYSFTPEEAGGAPDTQAGSHPFQVTTALNLNQGPVSGVNHRETLEEQPALPRNFSFRLPAGLIGNPNAVEQCSEARFTAIHELVDECPAASAIGVAAVTIIEHNVLGLTTLAVPVFNLVPAAGCRWCWTRRCVLATPTA